MTGHEHVDLARQLGLILRFEAQQRIGEARFGQLGIIEQREERRGLPSERENSGPSVDTRINAPGRSSLIAHAYLAARPGVRRRCVVVLEHSGRALLHRDVDQVAATMAQPPEPRHRRRRERVGPAERE